MLEDILLIAASGVALATGTYLWKSRDNVAVVPEQPEQEVSTRATPYLPPEIYAPAVEQPVEVFHKPQPVARPEAVLIKKSTLVDIYQTPLFSANIDEMAAIQKEMSEAIAVAGIPEPTASQWKMVLSSSRVDKVLAGAGAGKSSASSLRVVFLHRTLGVPLDQITVVTFTRASRADMVGKIIRDMAAFGITLTEPEARRVVRTFHSMILSLVEGHSAPVAYFEQIGGESGSHSEADDLGTLNPKQLDYLRDIFAKTFRENKAFSSGIGQILLEKLSIRQSRYADSESLDKAIAVAGPRDHIITRAVAEAWQEVIGLDERDGTVSWKPVALKTSKASGSWHANGKIVSTNMPIVLGCGAIGDFTSRPLDRSKYSISDFDKDRTLGALGNVRLKIVATIATGKYLYIETARDLADLYALVEWVNSGHNSDNTTFPAFSLRIPGDTRSSSIFEALYSLGSFIASTGLDVRTAALAIAKKMSKSTEFVLEMNVCLALAEFWPAMHTPGISTYDGLFFDYGTVESVGALPIKRLHSMRHLIIDEFQDISNSIINWIKSVHTVLVQHGEEPSLLGVGDDWQSIYGWRGSDPEFLLYFDAHFGRSEKIIMNENFRCGQRIIDCAEIMVRDPADSIFAKHGISAGKAKECFGEVSLMKGEDDAEIIQLVKMLRAQETDATIFILSRTNEGLLAFRKMSKDKKLSLLTMHRAKGLEADYVIIKGDCAYVNTSDLKNAVYALAGMSTSYDEAQQAEAMRLAYVSITRAKKHAYWFGEPAKPEGAFRVLAEEIGFS